MSKWIDTELFDSFANQKRNERETQNASGPRRSEIIFPTPEKGTQEKAKVYELRLLADPNGNFYKRIYYHGFYSGDRFMFILCPKTFDFDSFCPFDSAVSKLYTGTKSDKRMASNYKRKERFAGNVYVVDDPRDHERDDEEKLNETVKIYEFPATVESKLKMQVTDTKNGLGHAIFDPGEEGYNFLLRVLSKKPDANKRVWPDYSTSDFSRKPCALGSDKKIRKILDSCHDLDEYLEGMVRDDEEIVEVLKSEMLWDLIKDEWERHKGSEDSRTDTESRPEKKREEASKEDSGQDTDPEDADDASDEDEEELLKELDEL